MLGEEAGIPPFRRPIVLRINLAVPFNEKHAAKRLGAKWDGARKVWYVEDKENLQPFLCWMPSYLTKPHRRGK